MSAYRPYPTYKPSGVEWLGDVPEGWRTVPVFAHFRRVKETNHPDLQLMSVYRDYGVIPKASRDDNFNKASEDLNAYQRIKQGDLVLNKMKAWQGSIGVSSHEGIVSPAYFTYRPTKSSTAFDPNYLHHLVRSLEYIAFYLSRSKGIRVNQWDLDPDEFRSTPLICPPLPEQIQIASFLDRECGKLDALQAKQERLIALLKEKRQALISHTVTKGLNPHAKLKPSGIEWLGEVPEHWKHGPLKRFWEVIDCKHVTVPFLDSGIPVASVIEVREFELDLSQALRTSDKWANVLSEGGRRPSRGDVIYCRNTANTGTSAYVGTDERIALGQDVCLIKAERQNGRFLNYVLHSSLMASQLQTVMVGSTFKRVRRRK
jgi:type I restriction enzyme S subunit